MRSLTADGVRSPLSHIADRVFLTLVRELEDQGIGKKVAADMFGLALRSYRQKVHRMKESRTSRGVTLWEAVRFGARHWMRRRRDSTQGRAALQREGILLSSGCRALLLSNTWVSQRAERAVVGNESIL